MSLAAGARLGPYDILSAIGAGGMGEVYRARDTKLNRDVAIKILPEAVAADSDRIARFEREAQALAALNHPHIGAIYGFDQSQGARFLVLELVEGETLADRLERGAMPVEEALRVALQMADALEAAHEKGIVHRDLKPANVKITPEGTAKVLDFGLAKAIDNAPAAGNVTHSPTLSVMATQAGVILGTAAYMSPEQAKGVPADTRSDVFSFGAVLFEMLTGRQPFRGETAPEIMASVLIREPELSVLPPDFNPRLVEALKRCLDKNPKRRWQAVGDLRVELEAVASAPRVAQSDAPRAEPLWRRLALFSAPALISGAAIAAATGYGARTPQAPVTRTSITTAGAAALAINGLDRDLAISPDGRTVVYVGNNGSQILVRPIDQFDATALSGVGTPRGLFLSPDGQWIAYFDANTLLKKIAITGGPAITICSVPGGGPRGGAWGADGTILFATADASSGLWRVAAAGGEPAMVTKPDREHGEADHIWPEFMPDGQSALFTITSTSTGLDGAQIAVLDLKTGTWRVVVRGGTAAHYTASGHLVYSSGGSLRAVAFDLSRRQADSIAVPVVPQALMTSTGGADFDVAANGTLVYVLGGLQVLSRTLVWVDRQGHEEPISAPPRAYTYPRISPDGTRVLLDVRDQDNDIWVWDLNRPTLTRLTTDPGLDRNPVWTPDGRRIIYSSERGGNANIWWQAADGVGVPEQLTKDATGQFPGNVSKDGTVLTFWQGAPRDVMMVSLGGDHRVQPLVQTASSEMNGEISPDGRWLVYESTETGRSEIYVRPFPDVNAGRWQVSTEGGTRAAWSPQGDELFYLGLSATTALMRVPVERGTTWKAGAPSKLFEGPYFQSNANTSRTYDVSPDGKRFLMIKTNGVEGTPTTNIAVVSNWFEELKRLVPVK